MCATPFESAGEEAALGWGVPYVDETGDAFAAGAALALSLQR